MTLANASGDYPRILMGPTASQGNIQELADSIEAEGSTVHTFAAMPVEISLSKFDMAILVITDDDPIAAGGAGHRIQRTLHAAGFLEARLSQGRVCLLVEDTVEQLDAPPVTLIRYPKGRPMDARDEIVSFLSSQFPHVSADMHSDVPIRQQVQSSELRLGWAMLAAILLIAPISLILIVQSLGGDDDTVELDDVAVALGAGSPAGPEADELDARSELDDDSEVAGSTVDSAGDSDDVADDTAPSDAGDGDTTELLPDTSTTTTTAPVASPEPESEAADTTTEAADTTTEASAASLPATCTLDVRKSLVLPGSVECTGGGRLNVDGHTGPWHNNIAGVALGDGVSGTLTHEPRSDGTTEGPQVVTLVAGAAKTLNPNDAAFGVSTINVVFGANGQHIHLFESETDGGRQSTLTFIAG